MWIPLSILLLFDSGQFALSKVVTVDQPTQFFDCKDQEYSLLHKCAINGLQNKSETWEDSNDGLVQVKVKQNFFWHPVKRVRRECRTLSKRERGELWDAINALKKDESKTPNVYDWFANLHSGRAIYSVHFGPNFFGWHRIYNLRFEELLRKKNPNVTLCYWDSRADNAMTKPPLTIMFSPRFLGNPWGVVKTGPFSGWKTITGKRLRRDLGAKGGFIDRASIERILAQKSHNNISNPTAYEGMVLEDIHNEIHAAIGGQMADFSTSSQDPAFFIHHAFIDAVWERFCTALRKKGMEPQDDYVTQWVSRMQMPDKYMDRFVPYKNIDGYSHYFTNNIYQYEEFPECTNKCWDSPFLKCNKESNECYGFQKFINLHEKENASRKYRNDLSRPLSDVTILAGKDKLEDYVIVPVKVIFRNPVYKISIKSFFECDNTDRECSRSVAVLEARGITYRGLYTDYINADVSIPIWTYAFVAVKNPELGSSITFVSVTYKDGGLCQPMCLNQNRDKYTTCLGVLNVTSTDPKDYTTSFNTASEEGYDFDPLAEEAIDKRVKLKFVCSNK